MKSPKAKNTQNKLIISDSKMHKESAELDDDPDVSRHISHIIQLKDSMGYINITLSNSIHALATCITNMQKLTKVGNHSDSINAICADLSSIKQVLEDAFVKNSQSLVATPVEKKSKKVIQSEKISNVFSHLKQISHQKDIFSEEGSNLTEEFSLAGEDSKALMYSINEAGKCRAEGHNTKIQRRIIKAEE